MVGLGRFAIALCVIGMAGCDSRSTADLEYMDRRRAQIAADDTFASMSNEEGVERALALVKEMPAESGRGTIEEWMQRQLQEVEGQVLFPLWDARRRGPSKYEVRFTYTILRPDNSPEKHGVAWNVDLAQKFVGPARKLRLEDEPAGAESPR